MEKQGGEATKKNKKKLFSKNVENEINDEEEE